MFKKRVAEYNSKEGGYRFMSKRPVTQFEIDAFKKACQGNGISISQKPQEKIKSATISLGQRHVTISKDLKVVRSGNKTSK